jgi:hypothetical protein
MKILIFALLLFVGAGSLSAIMVLPPTTDTNVLAAILKAESIDAALLNYSFQNGRVDRLEHEITRLETGFASMSLLIGSTAAGVCILAVRDRIQERRRKRHFGEGVGP